MFRRSATYWLIDEVLDVILQQLVTPFPCFLWQVWAAYSFTARGNHEVSLQAGQPVRVLEPHDKRGNPEWNLVEVVSGQRGYVPSNYLTYTPTGAGPPAGFYPFH